MQYPAHFAPGDGGQGFVVTFRDIAEAITQGDDEADALDMAADVLLSAMDFYFDDKRPVPMPSAALPGERLIELPPSAAAKVLLLNEMLAQKVSNSELGRRIGASPQEMNRVIDLKHTTKIDTIWRAMAALGKKLEVIAK
ncbi:type II toxin-antitoxin system antitoxin HicB [Silvimonas sp. JCM 19000]